MFIDQMNILNEKWQIENKKLISIEFLDFLRNNKKFDNLTELKKQILKDKQEALKRIKNY